MSNFGRGRPQRRRSEPSYFAAISSRSHRSGVWGDRRRALVVRPADALTARLLTHGSILSLKVLESELLTAVDASGEDQKMEPEMKTHDGPPISFC